MDDGTGHGKQDTGPGAELEVRAPDERSPGLLAMGISPHDAIQNASAVASLLTQVLRDRGMTTRMRGRGSDREHVNVEGWTTLGAMTGHTAVVEWTRICEDEMGEKGWEARAVLQDPSGHVVAAAEGMCTRSERDWSKRDPYALRGMAQTRAISRAYRARLDFVVKMAGFATTPDEEMPVEEATTDQLREWLAESLRPLVDEFGRDPVNDAWKAAGKPWLRADRDQDAIARIRASCETADAPAVDDPAGDVVEPLAGEVVTEPGEHDAPQMPDPDPARLAEPLQPAADATEPADAVELGRARFKELEARADAAGIEDIAAWIVERFDVTSDADLADDDRFTLVSTALDAKVGAVQDDGKPPRRRRS